MVDAVGTEVAVADLIARVRTAAGSSEATAIRVALKRELKKLEHEVCAEPSHWDAWRDGIDVVGSAYEHLVRGADRRGAGQFQTPMWVAQLLAGWLAERKSEIISALAGHASTVKTELVALSADDPWSTRRAAVRRPRGRPLHELARVRRGVATGCKPFYVLSEQTRREHKLHKRYLRACARPTLTPDLSADFLLSQRSAHRHASGGASHDRGWLRA